MFRFSSVRSFEELREALILDKMENMIPDTNDLRKTKGRFVQAFILSIEEEEGKKLQEDNSATLLTKAEKYSAAVQAWMNSSVRGVLMSAKGQGHAGIPASLLIPSK